MTLPNRPSDFAPSPDETSIEVTAGLLSSDELTAIVDAEYQHVDYDRHPLSVRRFDHYIEGPLGDGRFHISG
ncbi:hypothetical protein [Dyella sp. EPa41]|uniref:hypothetical protein n=1 Tax=Dyella sp. EPa41 TaxID=1561194 RepID=UPI0019161292|nr:hypothetical protein [Dyella sp. EPa41]